MGILIYDGYRMDSVDVVLDEDFEKCPIAWSLGIPLMVKIAGPPKPTTFEEMTGIIYVVVRLMGDANTGLAPPRWQFGGINGPAPPVLVERSDGVPFTVEDWATLDNLIYNFPWEDGGRPTRQDLVNQVMNDTFNGLQNDLPAHAFLDVVRKLHRRYPKGERVKAKGLTSEEGQRLNDTEGVVTGRYGRGRVQVQFPDPFGAKNVKPCNLVSAVDIATRRGIPPPAPQ